MPRIVVRSIVLILLLLGFPLIVAADTGSLSFRRISTLPSHLIVVDLQGKEPTYRLISGSEDGSQVEIEPINRRLPIQSSLADTVARPEAGTTLSPLISVRHDEHRHR